MVIYFNIYSGQTTYKIHVVKIWQWNRPGFNLLYSVSYSIVEVRNTIHWNFVTEENHVYWVVIRTRETKGNYSDKVTRFEPQGLI